MATMQQVRPQTSTWSTIFPTEQVTQQQSALFVKKLLAVAISNITYLRTIFPEHAFGDRCLEDLSLKILRDDSACPGACQVIQWVKGCFDALDKKYLKTIVIGIYEDSKDYNTVVETYTFKFGYNHDEGVTIFRNGSKVAGAYSDVETRKATIKLLRTIVVLTQTLKPLPDDVMMTMKLYYFDDVTPSDYEPPGFQATSSNDFTFKETPLNIRVGDVDTPFHSVKLRIKTDCQSFAIHEDEELTQTQVKELEGRQRDGEGDTKTLNPSKRTPYEPHSPPHKTATGDSHGKAEVPSATSSAANNIPQEEEKMDTSDIYTVIDDKKSRTEKREEGREREKEREREREMERERERQRMSEKEREKERGREMERERERKKGLEKRTEETVEREEAGNIVRCPCGCNEDDGLMVLCADCDVWQHAVCFALLSEEDVPETHICVQCSQSSGLQKDCTDPFLQSLDPVTVQAACLWRRALSASLEFNRIVPPTFARRLGNNTSWCQCVAVSVAQGLVNRLEREGYIRVPMKNKRLGKIVNKDRIRIDGIRKYIDKVRKEARAHTARTNSKKLELNGEQRAKVVDITNGTSSLTISQNSTPPAKTAAELPQMAAIQGDENSVRRSPRIIAKRARSTLDQSIDFEVCNSQDTDYAAADGETQRKRRKASIASRSILV